MDNAVINQLVLFWKLIMKSSINQAFADWTNMKIILPLNFLCQYSLLCLLTERTSIYQKWFLTQNEHINDTIKWVVEMLCYFQQIFFLTNFFLTPWRGGERGRGRGVCSWILIKNTPNKLTLHKKHFALG